MLRSDALRNKIYLMSFHLTVVLSELLNRGRHMWWCGCVQCVCSRCRCVYESSQSYCDLALKKNCEVKKQYESIHNIPATLFNSAWKTTTTWPLSPHHHLCEDTTGFRFLYSLQVTQGDCSLIINSKDLNVYNFRHDFCESHKKQ